MHVSKGGEGKSEVIELFILFSIRSIYSSPLDILQTNPVLCNQGRQLRAENKLVPVPRCYTRKALCSNKRKRNEHRGIAYGGNLETKPGIDHVQLTDGQMRAQRLALYVIYFIISGHIHE